ncbi:AMP-binding protein [Pseudoalteromonas peptidolytica]|uniref:Fatty-acyl-CoA synthase n=1 Tax=Pseudoalteromonas peptidolytica F12-50-A1 TaxID=1315280 RepID=A0A8I0MUX7_9GAMM|nr:AMP-binding protein [Pseudoalteromonas peptidolytica]MBE0346310.1 fatty-acyl-CoA synthase [Pseudoalteromonas peptidolytica F12-50-A1]NLR14223.1 AMP-binding protein [Pseudoalteromonas peptidolytica]GEK11837.1 AMP-binding protein [Pseudoalteromonas peptidolytica]
MTTESKELDNYKLTKSYFTGSQTTPLTNLTTGQYFDSIVDNHSQREAIVVSHQSIRLTYRQYLDKINQLAASLLAVGIQPGDRVGIWSPNNLEWSLVQFATAKIGAIMVCINPAYRPSELEYVLNNVECKMLVMAKSFKHSHYVDMIRELAPESYDCMFGELISKRLPSLKQIVLIDEGSEPGLINFSTLLEMASDVHYLEASAIAANLNADQAINIQFTSGTTGNPKGATLTHRNILNNGLLVANAMKLTEQDKLCIPVPLYHCFGMVLGNLVCLSKGACAVFPNDSFDPLKTLQVVEQEQCTALHGVPTMFIAQLEHPNFSEFNLSSLRTGVMAGSTCPEKVMRQVQTQMHMTDVLIGYGQTECSPINNITEIDSPIDKRVQTVGRAMPHTEVKIIDELGHIAPIGTPGEVCARGYCVMQEYWQDPEKTAATIDADGWLHSGDLAVMDDQGFVSIVGRIKDMIIRGGENIYPREIEEVMYHHPDIQDAAVFGIQDDRYGEEVCAWVQLKPGHYISEDNIREFLKEKLAYFKIPKHIRLVDAYPMTVTGKLQKFKMRDQMEQELHQTA